MKYPRLIPALMLISALAAQTDVENAKEKVYQILKSKGVPKSFVEAAFSHDSVMIHEDIAERFANPAEKLEYKRYRRIFIKDERIKAGKEFYLEKQEIVDGVSELYGVDKYLLLSIAGVESNYGQNYKTYSVFNAYYTIMNRIPRRAGWATKELAEYLEYCYNDSVLTQSVQGSYAGAFGYGQFIPSSFNRFAVDHDGDGLRAHDQWPDVLASIANYLIKNGFKKGSVDYSENSANWDGIYAYNHSNHYVRVVIEFRNELESAIKTAKAEG